MAIIKTDDIDELFSELKYKSKITAPKPKQAYIELKLSEYALGDPVGKYRIIQTISTSQLEYNEQCRAYFVNCAPFQPFVTNVICVKSVDVFPQLKIALKSATTNKIAIMHVSGIEVIKQPATMANVVSIDFILDKEHNTNDINSTGIRMKMHVLVDEFEIGNPFAFEKKRKDTIKGMDAGWLVWDDMITTANDDFRATTKSIVTKQYEDAVARRIKEIKNQKKAEDEKVMSYKAALDMITELTKTDSSSGKVDADGMISKFLSVIKKIDF
jgi:hypothetical protein